MQLERKCFKLYSELQDVSLGALSKDLFIEKPYVCAFLPW
jgi:hypothetical protein